MKKRKEGVEKVSRSRSQTSIKFNYIQTNFTHDATKLPGKIRKMRVYVSLRLVDWNLLLLKPSNSFKPLKSSFTVAFIVRVN